MLLPITNVVIAADACLDVFPGAIQSHDNQGELTLRYNSSILGQVTANLVASKLHASSINNHCAGAACNATGAAARAIDLAQFIEPVNGDDISIPYLGEQILGLSLNNEFKHIDVGSSATLSFSADHNNYLIDKLNLGYGATLNLSPGDYWIERLKVGSNTSINITGNGVVRLFVKKELTVSHNAVINASAQGASLDGQKLFLFANKNINFSSNVQFNGLAYSRKNIRLGHSSVVNGAISAKRVELGYGSSVEYNPLAVQRVEYDNICAWGIQIDDLDGDGIPDEIDPDRDGDGISNYYESLVSTNPDDVTDAPADSNLNGIPDSLELGSGANQCESAFTTGLQSHDAIDSKAVFAHNAQLLNIASPYLAFNKIQTHDASNLLSCGTSNCLATGLAIEKLNPGEFKKTSSVGEYTVSFSQTAELDGSVNEYKHIKIKSNGALTLRNTQTYRIKKLSVGWNAKLRLEPGEYWIEKLNMGSDATMEVAGEGTVRLFIKKSIHLGWNSKINVNTVTAGSNAHKLFIYAYHEVFLASNTIFEGHVFSVNHIKLDYASQFYGAIAAKKVRLSANAKIYYQSPAVEQIDFGFVCDIDNDGIYDGFDTDRDGDGISNDYEIQVGTDPDNASNVPSDMDKDGIPDQIDPDRDGDGVDNETDAFPDNATESSDIDGDGIGDNTDPDRDGDGISNDYETQSGFNPNDPANTPPDLDGDAIPDSLDDDRDGDGVDNTTDVFPNDASETTDLDNDGIGDNSDLDRDGDGISNSYETQLGTDPNSPASVPPDFDKDGIPDSLDNDRDGDGVNNTTDVFPDDPTESTDIDADGIGDNADTDRDGDGISNIYETQLGTNPSDPASTPPDLDSDGIPDSLDDDRDGDGVNNTTDAFPNDASETLDLDNDGIGDNTDQDRDGDGISNAYETQLGTDPNNAASVPPDLDKDGIPDSLDDDRDGDGVNNTADIFPDDANESSDLDGDGIGDNTDTDRDGDGISNDYEIQIGTDPGNATSTPPDLDNDGIPDSLDDDRDGDGVNNDLDALPNDPAESSDLDGDGVGDNTDPDRDGDGISNDYEIQAGTDPDNASSIPADLDGDGIPDGLDNDRDGDNVNNDQDTYPDDANRSSLPAVTSLQANLQINVAQVQWQALSSEPVAGYNLYRNTTIDTNWVQLNSGLITATNYTDNNLSSGIGYRYRLTAVDTNSIEGQNSAAVELFAAFNTTAIQGFTLSLQGTSAQLNWQAVSGMQYQIYQGLNGATPSLLTTVSTNQYLDNTIAAEQSASYQVATLVTYNNSFTGQPVSVVGTLSALETVTIISLTPLTFGISNGTTAADGVLEISSGQNNLARVTGTYQNAIGEVSITAASGASLSVGQLSSNGLFELNLPASTLLTWQISIKDNTVAGRQASTQIRIVPDTSAPTLTIDGGNTRNTNAQQTILVGNISDTGSGIQSLTLQSDRYAGLSFVALITGQRFEVEQPLKTGANIIIATAIDKAGNQTQASITINRDIPAAPRIEISSPQNGSSTQNNKANLNGVIYSNQPSTDLRIEFASQQIFPTASAIAGIHNFSFSNITLQTGVNTLSVKVTSPLGADSSQTQVTYQAANPNQQDAVPRLSIQSPNNAIATRLNPITVTGRANSSKGIASVSINGLQVATGGTEQTSLSFNYIMDISSQAEGDISITIVATDTAGVSTTETRTVSKDTQNPVITLGNSNLQPAPTVNTVNANPYTLVGKVSDANIAGLSINNQTVTLLPSVAANEYTFEAQLVLPAQQNQALLLRAWDQAGQQSEKNLVLLADVSVGINIIAPVDNSEQLVTGATLNIDITAQLTDWVAGYQVQVIHQQDAPQTMTVVGNVAQHSLSIPTTEGRHTFTVRVDDGAGKVLSEATSRVNLINAAQIPLQISKSEPVNLETGVEPHLPITVFFNRPIDRSLIQINVFETFTGQTYDLEERQGKSALENQQVKLIQIDRNHAAVTGGLSYYPEDTLVSFYPAREFAYGGTVYVDVIYDGVTLAKQSYQIRALPTFVQGTVVNSNHQSLQGITVSLPGLSRESITGSTGNYGFGYGDSANKSLPAGRYKMVFNPGLKNRRYGMLERWVNIEAGRVKDMPITQLQVLHESTPFTRVNSGQAASLYGGDLQLDLSNAELYFPNGRKEGNIHLQFIEYSSLSYNGLAGAIPHWMYGVQPMGIKTSGGISLDFTMPALNGLYNYLPADDTPVVILGYHSESQQLMPVGVGRIQNRHVISRSVELDELSYLGYALVVADHYALLEQYAEGLITLDDLRAGLSPSL